MSNLTQILDIERDLQKQGLAPRGSLHLHNVRAEFTLKQDIENDTGLSYNLDSDIRDRLLAHTRQDVSLAVYTAHAAERLGLVNRRLLILIVALQCLLIWQLW